MSVGVNDWLECAKWLDKLDVLTYVIHQKLEKNELELADFAYGLHDGVILCNLINKLIPGNIDTTKINKAASGQLASRQNIKLFLNALEDYFDFSKQDLFEPEMLYNMEIECVLQTLAKLSETQVAKNIVEIGFTLSGDRDSVTNQIYYDLSTTVFQSNDNATENPYYVLDLLSSNELYNKIIKDGNICDTEYISLASCVEFNQTKEYLALKEIYETEVRYLSRLNKLIVDFIDPLVKYVDGRDRQIICINIKELKFLHADLVKKLTEVCQGTLVGRTSSVCQIFDSFKLIFMKEYSTYISNIQTSIDKLDYLTNKTVEFRKVLEECHNKCEMRTIKLIDLMRLPYERVLHYHILFETLHQSLNENDETKRVTLSTWSGMRELSSYLNESQRDHRCLKEIRALRNNLKDFILPNSTTIYDFGHLIKDESVRIKSNDSNSFAKKRALLLFDKALFICKSKGDNYYYKETILLNQFKLDDSSNRDSNVTNNLVLHNVDHSKTYTLYCKNDKEKREWKKSICDALDKIFPKDYNSNSHIFSFKNFGPSLKQCDSCNEVLYGVFHQGYECGKCGAVRHKKCLNKHPSCSRSSFNFEDNKISAPLSNKTSIPNNISKNKIFTAVHVYKGVPIPPIYEWPILKFDVNDLITVTDDDDDEWWKGFKLNTDGTEGYFPSCRVSYVEAFLPQLKDYNWYCDVDRQMAEKILKSIPCNSAIFLVRPRQENSNAISVKFKDTINHMIIHTTNESNNKTKYYIIEDVFFKSIPRLIQHYMSNTLENDFPDELQTTLGVPFREALPESIGFAMAIHDFEASASNLDTTINLEKDERVSIVNKNNCDWWLVFNNNGYLGYVPSGYLLEI